MSVQEDAFYNRASGLQQELLEINSLREKIQNYRDSERQFAELAQAEQDKLDILITEVRPKVVNLMQEFLTVTNPPSA